MTTTGIHVAYDDTSISLIPADAPLVLAYVDGAYKNYDAAVARFGTGRVRGITVVGEHGPHIYFCDAEPGDMSAAQAVAWVKHEVHVLRHTARGPYAAVSSMQAIIDGLAEAGVPRYAYPVWTAHYIGPHICGPHSCKYPGFHSTADGTQFTQTAHGKSLDESEITPRFLGVPPVPKPKPPKPSGKASAKVTIDFETGAWGIEGAAGNAHFAGPAEYWSAEVQVGSSGAIAGKWRVKGLKANAKPLGGE